MLRQRWMMVLAIGMMLVLGAGAAQAGEALKIGFVYVSPIAGAGWTYQHDLGRKAVEQALRAKVVTKYVENVPEGADAERVIRELAASGHKLVLTTSFGFMNPTIKVAPEFPNVAFMHATGYKSAKNVGIYNARFYEGRYLAGIVAGKMTKKNVAGYVGAFPIPEVLQGINAFMRGMRSVNPKAEMKVVWVNSSKILVGQTTPPSAQTPPAMAASGHTPASMRQPCAKRSLPSFPPPPLQHASLLAAR